MVLCLCASTYISTVLYNRPCMSAGHACAHRAGTWDFGGPQLRSDSWLNAYQQVSQPKPSYSVIYPVPCGTSATTTGSQGLDFSQMTGPPLSSLACDHQMNISDLLPPYKAEYEQLEVEPEVITSCSLYVLG